MLVQASVCEIVEPFSSGYLSRDTVAQLLITDRLPANTAFGILKAVHAIYSASLGDLALNRVTLT